MAMVEAIPSRLLLQPARVAITEAQSRLSQAQTEAASGRFHDVGLVLGGKIASDVGLRLQLSSVEQMSKSGEQASLRSDAVQSSLAAINALADRFRSTLTGSRNAEGGRALAGSAARSAYESLIDATSVTYDGQYLFSGTATESRPLNDYSAGPRQSILDAFQAEFGFSPDDPAARNISPDQITNFLNGSFASLFNDANWRPAWSSANDDTMKYRAGGASTLDLSTTTNAPFARSLAQGISIVDVFAKSQLSAATYTAAADKALSLTSQAQVQVADEQSRIGLSQASLKSTGLELAQKKNWLTSAISSFENVDPYEATTRVNILMTQLESAYALTGRISKLSLLSYI